MRWFHVTLVALAVAYVACSSSTEPLVRDAGPLMDGTVARRDSGTDAGSPVSCATTDDCTYSEIDHEILRAADCPCLFGCPFAPVNRAAAARRMMQYTRLCDPRHDGMGSTCGIDDCAMPPPLVCSMGTCLTPRR